MEEIIDVVDEDDNFVRKAARDEVRENSLMHRVSRVIILDSEGMFLVQKRSKEKDMYPGHWDIGIAGTVKSNESYEGTAMRELMEELNIAGISNIQLIKSYMFKITYHSDIDNKHVKVYKLKYDGKIIPQKEEIDEVNFLMNDKVLELIEKEKFHPIGRLVFEKYLELKTGQN